MDELQDLRREIDAIDRELVELFRRRMDVTARVGAYKRERGIPVLDQERERQVLRNKGELAGEALRPAVITLYQTIMALSRRQQRDLMGKGADNPGLRRWQDAQASAQLPIEHPRGVEKFFQRQAAGPLPAPQLVQGGIFLLDMPLRVRRAPLVQEFFGPLTGRAFGVP